MKRIISNKRYSVVAALLLIITLVCMVPYRADAQGNLKFQKNYFSLASNTDKTTDEVDNYVLSVIEDDPVPLSSGEKDYSDKAFSIVAVCIVFAFIALYIAWYRGHKRRITSLMDMAVEGGSNIDTPNVTSIIHPIRTIRFENELENRVVSNSTKSV